MKMTTVIGTIITLKLSPKVLNLLTDVDTGFSFDKINGYYMPKCFWTIAETSDLLKDGHAVGYEHPYVAIYH